MSRKKSALVESNGLLAIRHVKLPKKTLSVHSLKKKPVTRIGETSNFIVDYDSVEGIVLLYGKEASKSHGFKLGLDKSETTAVINLLKQAKNFFNIIYG